MGTGDRKRMLGQENQRSATVCSISGVHKWTMTIAIRTPRRQSPPLWRGMTTSGASDFMTSHPAPSSPYRHRRPQPTNNQDSGKKKNYLAVYYRPPTESARITGLRQ